MTGLPFSGLRARPSRHRPTGRRSSDAGDYRVYEDPADLLRHLDEVGVRIAE